jgi:transcriptional regulator with XRE-family HTH domain
MTQPPSDRLTKPLDRDVSYAARLGFEIRKRRQDKGLTLKALASMIGFSLQHLSEVERANAPMSGRFVAACDLALEAQGSLLALLEAVVCERAMQSKQQSVARQRSDGELADAEWEVLIEALQMTRYAGQQPSDAGEDVDLSRRSLLGAGVGAALGLDVTTAPASAQNIDPELVGHWMTLLKVLDQHRVMFGPHKVLDTVRKELDLIAKHRQLAHGELRTQLLRVEARWSALASWLAHDMGSASAGDYWAARAVRLAQEAGYQDMVAWMLMRESLMHQSQSAHRAPDPKRAITFAQAAGRTPGVRDQVRAICSLREAQAHALANDAASCERSLADAHTLLDRLNRADDPDQRDDLGGFGITRPSVLAAEARCWLRLQPSRAITMLEAALHIWPHNHVDGRGVHQARLATACAATNQPDRAATEGLKALDVARTTKSDVTVRELKRLDQRLAACDTAPAAEFREAFAAL